MSIRWGRRTIAALLGIVGLLSITACQEKNTPEAERLLAEDAAGSYYDAVCDSRVHVSFFSSVAAPTDGVGAEAKFDRPYGLAIDAQGDLFVGEFDRFIVRKVTLSGAVTTVAGSPSRQGCDDGRAPNASFYDTTLLTTDTSGNIYVADAGVSRIRKISSDGAVSTLPHLDAAIGLQDLLKSPVGLNDTTPKGIVADAAGNLYVSVRDAVLKITPDGTESVFAGSPQRRPRGHEEGPAGTERRDGFGIEARFKDAGGMTIDGAGNLYVIDLLRIRKITPDGYVSTLPVAAPLTAAANNLNTAIRYFHPHAIAVAPSGDLYVTDAMNAVVDRISPSGFITIFAGKLHSQGREDGPAATARFAYPNGIAVGSDGNIYVADSSNDSIRKITPSGDVSTFAGVSSYIEETYSPRPAPKSSPAPQMQEDSDSYNAALYLIALIACAAIVSRNRLLTSGWMRVPAAIAAWFASLFAQTLVGIGMMLGSLAVTPLWYGLTGPKVANVFLADGRAWGMAAIGLLVIIYWVLFYILLFLYAAGKRLWRWAAAYCLLGLEGFIAFTVVTQLAGLYGFRSVTPPEIVLMLALHAFVVLSLAARAFNLPRLRKPAAVSPS